jgi:hypothetical protein
MREIHNKRKSHPRWCSKHQCIHNEVNKYPSCRLPNLHDYLEDDIKNNNK